MQKEINKFLKKIQAAKLKNNHKECIELYNIVGGMYSDIGSYEEAIYYHDLALDECKTIGNTLSTAVAFRYIGEAKAALGNYNEAIVDIRKYLELAEKAQNKIETQRAWTTLGRVYLMKAQDMKDKNNAVDKKVKEAAREAEKQFQRALFLAESVHDDVGDKEYAQMKSSLYINLGLISDICGNHSDAIAKLKKAIELCKSSKLKEDLHRCQTILASIYRQRDIKELAAKTSEEALQTAKSIGRKLLICDSLIERGLVEIIYQRFKSAKRYFAQAYLEKSPNEDDHIKAIRLTKIAHIISDTHDRIVNEDPPAEVRLQLRDKMGDLLVSISAYKQAIKYYSDAAKDAKIAGKPKSELARILFSLAETYVDDGQYEQALRCYDLELKYRKGNKKEQCQTLIKIAHVNEYLNKDSDTICESYEKALSEADQDLKLKYNILKDYVPYMEKKSINQTRCIELKNVLEGLKSFSEVVEEIAAEEFDEVEDPADEIADIDDIITDDDENEEVIILGKRKKRGLAKFKPDELGNTPLHEACIKGDLRRVKYLISQGHDINPRDNAGWIPLHEACNHGHFEIVQILLEHGADVNYRGLKGMSPLHDAATNGHFGIMRLLLQKGANVIALTDTDMDEYKYMENELINEMDRCGFDIMDIKDSKAPPKHTWEQKQKKDDNKTKQNERPINTNIISRSQLRWDVDDDDGDEDEDDEDEDDEDEDGVEEIQHISHKRKRLIEEIDLEPELVKKVAPPKQKRPPPPQPQQPPSSRQSSSSLSPSPSPTPTPTPSSFNHNEPQRSTQKEVELHRVIVHIEEHKLIIPIKDKLADVKWLKNSIVERYSIITEHKANIRIAPKSEPNCILFDQDLCRDVIYEDLVATIESWQLKSLEASYIEGCHNSGIQPIDFIKIELRGINESAGKLNLTFTRFPKRHINPIIAALKRRDFSFVNLTGAICLFERDELVDTMTTWRKLVRLNLQAVGLKRGQFETICRRAQWAQLESLDMSFNTIIYKSKDEFIEQIESLCKACPRLKWLNMRRNHLLFPIEAAITAITATTGNHLELLGSDQREYTIY